MQGKIWGHTNELFNKNNVEIHRICIESGGYCSTHKHCHKYNMFFVERGTLIVDVWKNDYDLVDRTILKSNQSTIVKPKEYHRFIAEENTVAYEIYWTELDQSDIIRKDCGGNQNNSPIPLE